MLEPPPLFLPLGDGQLRSQRETDRIRDVLRARTTTAILRAAVEQWFNDSAATDVHRADALRRADLVAGDGEDVEGHCLRVDGDLPQRLHGVGMKQCADRLGV